MSYGIAEGDICNRPTESGKCVGIMKRATGEGCSCHINPPCGDCTEVREYCPECDFDVDYDEEYLEEDL